MSFQRSRGGSPLGLPDAWPGVELGAAEGDADGAPLVGDPLDGDVAAAGVLEGADEAEAPEPEAGAAMLSDTRDLLCAKPCAGWRWAPLCRRVRNESGG